MSTPSLRADFDEFAHERRCPPAAGACVPSMRSRVPFDLFLYPEEADDVRARPLAERGAGSARACVEGVEELRAAAGRRRARVLQPRAARLRRRRAMQRLIDLLAEGGAARSSARARGTSGRAARRAGRRGAGAAAASSARGPGDRARRQQHGHRELHFGGPIVLLRCSRAAGGAQRWTGSAWRVRAARFGIEGAPLAGALRASMGDSTLRARLGEMGSRLHGTRAPAAARAAAVESGCEAEPRARGGRCRRRGLGARRFGRC